MAAPIVTVVGKIVPMICSHCRRRFWQQAIDFSRRSTQLTYGHISTRYFHRKNSQLRHGEYEWKDPKSEDEVVSIVYIDKNGKRYPVKGKIGDNAMYLAHRHGIEIEGACEASLACCTCHVYVQQKYHSQIPEPVEEEEDMLDMAPFLKDNSRLSCQIILTKELDGMELTLPPATRNFYVDGHVPQAH
ncbi:hypothetical protein ACJMK2_042590 [Sinanodonta woodiana]|uniref:2Fe-2S ferredoxin-type domain-containing protein n=1 Tax=Sinanodonta woodiana TaxID=1069815 RepID=A0ABD3W8W6_SINWO